MYSQQAVRLTGMKVLPGTSCSRRVTMPVSVTTMNSCAALSRARWTMPSVEYSCNSGRAPRIFVEQPHSGWMSSSASGYAACWSVTSSGRMASCTWQAPSQTSMARPVARMTCAARKRSGANRTGTSAGRFCTICTAFPLVQQ